MTSINIHHTLELWGNQNNRGNTHGAKACASYNKERHIQQVFQDKIHIRDRIGDQKCEHDGIEAQQNCSLIIGDMNQLDNVPLDSPDKIG